MDIWHQRKREKTHYNSLEVLVAGDKKEDDEYPFNKYDVFLNNDYKGKVVALGKNASYLVDEIRF